MIARGSGEHRPISIGEPDKVKSWPFKDKVKVTDRRIEQEPAKDAPIQLRDHELEKAQRRTAEIKALMSPPGSLRLPPLLDAARIKWGIPDSAFACQAVFDRIHIFPIDFEGLKDTWGTSSIIRPEATQKRDVQNGHRGILISMGLTAADHCVSHGIELGHVVRTIRNAPHTQECARITDGSIFYLVMRDGDLTGSETQMEQLRSNETQIVDEGGDHSYCFNIDGRKKKVALIQDNW